MHSSSVHITVLDFTWGTNSVCVDTFGGSSECPHWHNTLEFVAVCTEHIGRPTVDKTDVTWTLVDPSTPVTAESMISVYPVTLLCTECLPNVSKTTVDRSLRASSCSIEWGQYKRLFHVTLSELVSLNYDSVQFICILAFTDSTSLKWEVNWEGPSPLRCDNPSVCCSFANSATAGRWLLRMVQTLNSSSCTINVEPFQGLLTCFMC